MNRLIILILLVSQVCALTAGALPQRLVIALDGVAYRDMKALQSGVTDSNFWGDVQLQAFTEQEGYFPVSRLISTFPSTSDVAWTDIFGDRPLPGYQRTYFSAAANSEISLNGLTTTVEHERQMDWQTENNFVRSMGYLSSVHTFNYELSEMVRNFWNTDSTNSDFYVYIRSSDDAQHLDRNILAMLSTLDKELQKLRARYQAQEGHDLQIVILSDHGHNHAGRGRRVPVRSYLEKAGYRIVPSLTGPKDVVLPTAGIEDWIEIHNSPPETESLAETLSHLEGVDLLAARLPGQPHHFLVLNSKGERAMIEWNPAKNTFRYSAEKGDPLDYGPASRDLADKKLLDANGFASADDWMNETITNHYPLALQRIARGLTRVTLNPATILVSLDNRYVNDGWLVNEGSELTTCGSTHGALDSLNSVGIVLSNFVRTHDTSSDRIAACFDNFPGLRNYRAAEDGAEWVSKNEQAAARIPRDPFDRNYHALANDEVFLRVWSPQLARADTVNPLEATIEKISDPDDPPSLSASLQPVVLHEQHITFGPPLSFPETCSYEKIYDRPAGLRLEPYSAYRMSGWTREGDKDTALFEIEFRTDKIGNPVAY